MPNYIFVAKISDATDTQTYFPDHKYTRLLYKCDSCFSLVLGDDEEDEQISSFAGHNAFHERLDFIARGSHGQTYGGK